MLCCRKMYIYIAVAHTCVHDEGPRTCWANTSDLNRTLNYTMSLITLALRQLTVTHEQMNFVSTGPLIWCNELVDSLVSNKIKGALIAYTHYVYCIHVRVYWFQHLWRSYMEHNMNESGMCDRHTLFKRFKSCTIIRFIRFCDVFSSSIEHYQAVVKYYVLNYCVLCTVYYVL